MRDPELLRLDHARNAERLRALGEVRFRLLAFVPTITGATVAVLPARAGPSAFLAVGLVGLTATLGIFLYELRNSEVLAQVRRRVLLLERGLDPDVGPAAPAAGAEEPRGDEEPRLLGLVRPTHVRGLALVYAAALAGWAYLVGWGALGVAGVPAADAFGGIAALAFGVAIVVGAERFADAGRGGARDGEV